MIEKLIQINTIVAFIADVVAVGKKLDGGRISSARELELELICAGKVCLLSSILLFPPLFWIFSLLLLFVSLFRSCLCEKMLTTKTKKMSSQSTTTYTRFYDHVTSLCDTLYTHDTPSSSASKTRTSHHIKDISILKSYLPEESYEQHHDSLSAGLSFEDEDLCFDFVGASVEGHGEAGLNVGVEL